jgi:hypothetical protein
MYNFTALLSYWREEYLILVPWLLQDLSRTILHTAILLKVQHTIYNTTVTTYHLTCRVLHGGLVMKDDTRGNYSGTPYTLVMHTAHSTQHTAHSTLHTAHCTLHNVRTWTRSTTRDQVRNITRTNIRNDTR